jgi:hypothetical protein
MCYDLGIKSTLKARQLFFAEEFRVVWIKNGEKMCRRRERRVEQWRELWVVKYLWLEHCHAV